MCGRFSLTHPREKVAKRFNVEVSAEWKPRFNIAPTQQSLVITNKNPKEAFLFRWGLIPNWSLNEKTGHNLINAKAETVISKSPFKQLIHSQRCLILADGFYEWKPEGKKKTPYRITLASDDIFAFAGVWDTWDHGDDVINSFTVITTAANELVQDIHDRMPVILPKDLENEWIKKELSDKEITELLQPYDSNKMSSYKTHRAVNSPTTDSPECIQVAPKIYPGETFSLFD